MARWLIVLSFLAASSFGCATSRAAMTFADAGLADPDPADGAPALTVKVAPPLAAPPGRAAAPASGPPLDGALLRFAAEARARRGRSTAGQGFPAAAVQAWQALIEDLARYLRRPASQTPLLELIRARVTLEAELENDRRRYGEPPERLEALVARRVARLASRMAAARALGQGLLAPVAPSALQWPIEGAGLSSLFGPRLHPLDGVRRMHQGVDLAAPSGTVVLSAAAGLVTYAGWVPGYGLMVEIQHPGGLTTRYGHLSRVLCGVGEQLDVGQLLGQVGATGKATGPHLHFEVRQSGRVSDPLAVLGGPWLDGGAGH